MPPLHRVVAASLAPTVFVILLAARATADWTDILPPAAAAAAADAAVVIAADADSFIVFNLRPPTPPVCLSANGRIV